CDGRRPICGPCRKRAVECVYSARESLGQEASEILDLLKWLPEQRAFDALRILRAKEGDCIAALPLIKGNLGEQPIPLVTLDAIFLESRFGNDADSAVNRYRAYGTQVDSLVVSRRYCDERLSSLCISSWTTVHIHDELAARIISLYLEVDHPLLGTFDPDLFVADLISVERRHCSSLLVNALLYWGCQMYSAIDQTVTKLAQSFCAEAEKLWSETKHDDTCLNMAGAQLLSLAYMGHAKTIIAWNT
ncbi:hypothetical protein PG991_009350, partial [Apiospora marii]